MRLLFLFLFLPGIAVSQVKSISAGIDGLTCSMCSNGVEKTLEQLAYIKDVKMDLNENIALIELKRGDQIDFALIGKKVQDAGYSVRFLEAVIQFNGVEAKDGELVQINGSNYRFLKVSPVKLEGDVNVKFIGKNLLPKKEMIQWDAYIRKFSKEDKGNNVFYITL